MTLYYDTVSVNILSHSAMLEAIVQSIFEPGVSPKLLVAVNVVFSALVLTGLIVTIFVTFSYHVLFLTILGLALIISINWFVGEMAAAESNKQAKD